MGTKYPAISSSGYNSSPPSDDGTVSASNQVFWNADVLNKVGGPLKSYIDAVQAALMIFTNFGSSTISGTYNTVAGDHMTTLEASGTFTISLMDANTAGAGYIVSVKNVGAGVITIALVTAANTLDGTVNGTATLPVGGYGIYKTNAGATGYYSLGSTVAAVPVPTRQVITGTGTYTRPAGLTIAKVRLQAPGGGSGGCAATSASQGAGAGGGGGGGYSERLLTAAQIGASQAVTIGAVGAAGAAGNNAGGTGGTTSFGALLSATGGVGGAGGINGSGNNTSAGGTGGVGSSGDFNCKGGDGGFGLGQGALFAGQGGAGGNSVLGGGGAPGWTTGQYLGVTGGNYGAGASGTANGQSQGAPPGKAGGPGIVIVDEYYS